ncbi:large subunit ribosomal protein L25 [Microbacteriaceae bacterium SG_E_30_P1]|uniref:Large ribosomal subunit protein bL25 n=1 Tax=Antiquaquibacter oligotrophicus TaxID=2880260 RepID=A0ABT6KJW2_9MICO|nr:50S ribosomal protein L25/general stress protein Ctc [Antiquaquibacter oligotrophicus]MDH6180292.1 large subunit ribosomal protein L25 [Antiquaquibacter oligotrophicus]UDF13961.1 50S ribosomal protein L25/general stress protein Ctc [Antiquaquibacter oligotrophicus]
MAEEVSNHLVTEERTQFGKGAARRIRAVGKIPAVIYGHGTEPQHVTLPGHEVSLILRKANQVLELDIAGKTQLALVKDVQKDPVRQIIEHVDLIVVRKGEKVTVDVPVHLEGESFSGTIAVQDAATISLEVEATHIPENVVVSIEGLEEGAHVLAKDIELPKGASLLSEPELLIVGITVPRAASAADDAADAASAEAGAAAGADSAAEDAE